MRAVVIIRPGAGKRQRQVMVNGGRRGLIQVEGPRQRRSYVYEYGRSCRLTSTSLGRLRKKIEAFWSI